MSRHHEPPSGTVSSYKDAPTRTVSAGGVDFAYRELGPADSPADSQAGSQAGSPANGVPLVLVTHLAAVLDNWDPRVVDGLATERRVIAFDNRGVGASTGTAPGRSRRWARTPSRSSGHSAWTGSTCSGSRWAAWSPR